MIDMRIDHSSEMPIYHQVAEALVQEVRGGRLRSGEKLPSEAKLASSLAVNPYTVSRAYGELVRRGILVQRRGLGTSVTARAGEVVGLVRESRLRRITVVAGVDDLNVIPSAIRFISLGIFAGIAEVAESMGVDVRLATVIPDAFPNGAEAEEGLVLLPALEFEGGQLDLKWALEASRRKLPVVAIDHVRPWPGFPNIGFDLYESARLACRHLIDCGYRSIGFFGALGSSSGSSALKYLAYVNTMREAGLDIAARHVRVAEFFRPGQAHRAAIELLDHPPLPEAIFTDTDYKAIEVICALQSRGISVPRDIGIVGFDGVAEGRAFELPLTTVAVSWKEIGRRAARTLLEWPPDGPRPPDVAIDTELRIGKTTCRRENRDDT